MKGKIIIMVHYMKLCKEPFDMIASGEKTIELRLYDEKRQLVKVGNTIIFACIDCDNKTINTEVVKIYRYDSFEDLYKSLPLEKCGYRIGEAASPVDMEKYYSKEEQAKYGVVGIEIKVK